MPIITKNQIRSQLKKILELLEQASDKLADLQNDTSEEVDNIEPYEGKEELTPQQEERQEELQEIADQLDEQISNLDDIKSELENIIY